jgi:hypothetical protein
MSEAPTKEGQNKIISALSQIWVWVVISVIGGLFTWGINLNRTITEQKDQYDQTITELHGQINSLQNELNDAEKDIADLQLRTEAAHDDTRVRLTHLEDWQSFHNSK